MLSKQINRPNKIKQGLKVLLLDSIQALMIIWAIILLTSKKIKTLLTLEKHKKSLLYPKE